MYSAFDEESEQFVGVSLMVLLILNLSRIDN
jgi:hypothetical protein